MARTKQIDRTTGATRFTEENLELVAKDLQSGRLPLMRTQLSDDFVAGLRALVNKSGLISFHISYAVGDRRPFMKLGDLNKDSPDHISLKDAREVAKTVKKLGDRGIDPQDGLLKRLVFELKRDGENWKLPKIK